ncbi:hypothetical protein [Streptomyces sp. NPDC047000]|uniref:SCO4983 family protein n=1 Tax=Streptomyces sp. NPDC047000 TaxID=3155474 RepID=UPI0033E944D0
MYEPIRTTSVHRSVPRAMAGTTSDGPHRSREEELDIQLAGHLAALLAVTDELRALAPSADLDTAAERLARQVTRLRGGRPPARTAAPSAGDPHAAGERPGGRADTRADAHPDAHPGTRPAALHRRAHTLAGRALVVAASRADTTAAILAAERMDAHAAAQELSAA